MIDMSKIEVGQVYSYKKLCELTGTEYKQGKSQQLHIEGMGEDGFARFMKLEKVGYGKYQVKEIYETPYDIIDKRKYGNVKGKHWINNVLKSNPCFDVAEENAILPGVYKIENDKYIYIGSTTRQLSTRFSEHFNNNGNTHQNTHDILMNDGVFTCLESFDKTTEEYIIRERELYYILYYRKNSSKTVINKLAPYIISDNKFTTSYDIKSDDKKIKFKYIKIPDDYYNDIETILFENGYVIENNTINILS